MSAPLTLKRLKCASMKRAAVMFTLPDEGRMMILEDPGKTDDLLRKAIKEARKVFWQVYLEKEQKEKRDGLSEISRT